MEENNIDEITNTEKYILGLVNDWLKFAESKNALLLTADTAIILGISSFMIDNIKVIKPLWLGILDLSLFGLAAIICLMSLLPSINLIGHPKSQLLRPGSNIFFFGDLANYSSKELVKALRIYTGIGNNKTNKFDEDLAEQIIVNSIIAKKKFRFFNICIFINLIAIIAIIVSFVLFSLQ
jgi:hypothetical protein